MPCLVVQYLSYMCTWRLRFVQLDMNLFQLDRFFLLVLTIFNVAAYLTFKSIFHKESDVQLTAPRRPLMRTVCI